MSRFEHKIEPDRIDYPFTRRVKKIRKIEPKDEVNEKKDKSFQEEFEEAMDKKEIVEVKKEKHEDDWMGNAIDLYAKNENRYDLVRKIYSQIDSILERGESLDRDQLIEEVKSVRKIASRLYVSELGIDYI